MITQRDVQESDFPDIEKNIRADQCHVDWMKPAFFVEPNTKSIAYENDGVPILYARLSSALRIHIQFCDVEKEHVRRVLVTQFADIVQRAKANGYQQIIFETESRPLALFCRRYLGFTSSPHEQVLWLNSL